MGAQPEWVAPLVRGIAGLAAFALLALLGRRRFAARPSDEPLDTGMD